MSVLLTFMYNKSGTLSLYSQDKTISAIFYIKPTRKILRLTTGIITSYFAIMDYPTIYLFYILQACPTGTISKFIQLFSCIFKDLNVLIFQGFIFAEISSSTSSKNSYEIPTTTASINAVFSL